MYRTLQIKANEGEDKVLPLREAVEAGVRPGMSIHASLATNSSLRQITRSFIGKNPQFTIISNAVGPDIASLVIEGMVRKLITSNCSFYYPRPGPMACIQQAYEKREIDIENWSTYALVQRLMASAFGLNFIQARSMAGTTMAEENPNDFQEIEDPFDSTEKLGVVRAMSPDVSLIHGCVADRYGNTILSPPQMDGIWGAAASKHGAIVTVERLVDTDYIRSHANFIHLPGYLVRSVSVVPFGAHPMGMLCEGLDGLEGYSADYDFLGVQQKAVGSPDELKSWTRQWVLDCKDEQDYVRLLGEDRINTLKRSASEDTWREELDSAEFGRAPSSVEKMVLAGAAKIQEIARNGNCRTLLAGAGASAIAAYLAYYKLQDEGYGIDLIEGFGLIGYAPRPACSVVAHVANMRTAKMFPDISVSYGLGVAGGHNRCLSVLGAAVIDKFGNINNSKIGGRYLIGPGGGTDAAKAQQVIIVAAQSKRRFVERVDYISCPGETIRTMVTDLGIFEKLGGDEFILTGYLPDEQADSESAVRRIRETCGWELKIAPDIKPIELPDADELTIIRSLDPQRVYLKE